MRRITVLSLIAAGLLGLAVYIHPAVGIPHPGPSADSGGVPPVPLPAHGVVGDVVTLAVTLSNTHVLQGSDGQVFLDLTVAGQERERIAAPHRLPMNLAIVIDRSGSMGGGNKIEYARQAAEFLVDQLVPSDRVSLVAYDHNVQVLFSSHLVGDGEELRASIRRLQPGGNTNLHGGMVTGAQEVQRHLASQQVNRVILISDGLANAGIADTPALTRIAQEWANRGVSVTAMGVGVDFNEDLMLGLAEYSSGNYYYIDEPAKLAGIFQNELTQLVATVAQDASVTITLADGVQCVDVPGYTFHQAGNTLTVPLGDIPAGRTRRLLVNLRVPTDAAGAQDVAQCRVEYLDAADGRERTFETATLGVERTANDADVASNRNLHVLEQNERVQAATVVEQAVELYEAGRNAAAQALLSSTASELRRSNAADYRSDELDVQAQEMEALVDAIANAPVSESAEGKAMRKGAKARSYEQKK